MSSVIQQLTHQQRAEADVQAICHKWKSSEYRQKAAMREADFLIGLLGWIVEDEQQDCRAAIEVFRQFIDTLV